MIAWFGSRGFDDDDDDDNALMCDWKISIIQNVDCLYSALRMHEWSIKDKQEVWSKRFFCFYICCGYALFGSNNVIYIEIEKKYEI